MKSKQIVICLGSSCYRRGNRQVLNVVKNWIKANDLEGFTDFRGELCTGNCSHGPIIKINGETMHVDETSIIHILEKYFSNKFNDNKDE